jgi:DNA helicase-2/ATP-dependent DNA helicase PcrA
VVVVLSGEQPHRLASGFDRAGEFAVLALELGRLAGALRDNREWHAVYVLNLVDGCIPSDMATGKPAQIEEERRLLYVAMTRAKEHLYLIQPLRFFRSQQHRFGDGHMIAPRSRFLTDDMLTLFTRMAAPMPVATAATPASQAVVGIDIGTRLRAMWD